MGKKETEEAFGELLDSLPSTDKDAYTEHAALIKSFPDRSMHAPDRRGGLHVEWSQQWPFYEVTFNGWVGAAGRRERELVGRLAGLGDEDIEAGFVDSQGYAQMRITVAYADMPLDAFRRVLKMIKPYRVDSGYTWVEYADIEEALRG